MSLRLRTYASDSKRIVVSTHGPNRIRTEYCHWDLPAPSLVAELRLGCSTWRTHRCVLFGCPKLRIQRRELRSRKRSRLLPRMRDT